MPNPVEHLDIYSFYGKSLATQPLAKRLVYRLIPQHTVLPFWSEVRIGLVRVRARQVEQAWRGRRNLLLNIGAGNFGKPGWVNIDVFRGNGINCLYDCRKKLPFDDGAAQGIFCEHFFEHVDYTEEAPFFLSECLRVLAPGGVLRLIVPDAGRYLRAYCADDWGELASMRSLAAGHDPYLNTRYQTRMELINAVFRQGYEHKFVYDAETLTLLLQRYGFANMTQTTFGHSQMPALCIDRPERAPESLYMEAVKPA